VLAAVGDADRPDRLRGHLQLRPIGVDARQVIPRAASVELRPVALL
jgi:hypothetical protein